MVIDSCLGATSGSGNVILPRKVSITEAHVSQAARDAKDRKQITWVGVNSVLRHEPTWGDANVIVSIVRALQPSNFTQVSASISNGHAEIKVLQTIRNAAAHSNQQTLGACAAEESA